mmetsp:Transcript_1312/g.3870  ORF Transcript_1312/g.3870 Transcript_1312/m.3870 type:complete len:358 (-) Transcript_1312:522-1595(-)
MSLSRSRPNVGSAGKACDQCGNKSSLVKNPWGAEGYSCALCTEHRRGSAFTCQPCGRTMCRACGERTLQDLACWPQEAGVPIATPCSNTAASDELSPTAVEVRSSALACQYSAFTAARSPREGCMVSDFAALAFGQLSKEEFEVLSRRRDLPTEQQAQIDRSQGLYDVGMQCQGMKESMLSRTVASPREAWTKDSFEVISHTESQKVGERAARPNRRIPKALSPRVQPAIPANLGRDRVKSAGDPSPGPGEAHLDPGAVHAILQQFLSVLSGERWDASNNDAEDLAYRRLQAERELFEVASHAAHGTMPPSTISLLATVLAAAEARLAEERLARQRAESELEETKSQLLRAIQALAR